MKNIFSLIIFVLMSCSHMKRGQHVYWNGKTDLNVLARAHQTTVEEIKKLNPNLKSESWVFIPNKIGWYFFDETKSIDDYSIVGNGEWMWPVPGVNKVSSGFGQRGGRPHHGIDIPGKVGTPIVAAKAGRVKYSDNRISGYGNMIILEHGHDVFSVYAHNDENLVDEGDTVKQGEQIAELGNTGRSSGPHLHFEIRVKNTPRNPTSFIKPPQLARH
jgi:murein DD-endopeptidase MepM/ murein hydrolase activator NlpD